MARFRNWLLDDLKAILISIRSSQFRTERIIMGLKEDFTSFVAAVNERTNEIGAALDEIRTDIEGMLNPSTPPDVVSAMTDITAKLQALSDTSKAIAALNNAVVPPPVEPV